MKSPFPGMDPYLERHWGDVHQALVVYARDALNTKLPGDLLARMEERVIDGPADTEDHGEGYVVIQRSDGRLITCIEFLTPDGKTNGRLREHAREQSRLLAANINVVLIDLVRRGDWRGLLPARLDLPALDAAYRVINRRASRAQQLEYYPIPLRQKLPSIPMPLRETEPDAFLDLQALHDQTYQNGRISGDRLSPGMRPALGRR